MSENAGNGGIQKCEENISEKKKKVEKFPMLKLPDLVREMVIRLMDPVEIFDFSQTSKRMHRTVKRSCRHKTYHLHLQAGLIYQAALYPPTYPAIPAEPARFRFQSLNGETESDPKYDRHVGNFQKIHANFQEEKGLYFFHKSHWEITKQLIAELQNLMNIKFQQVRIFLDGIENRDHKPLIEWLNTFPNGIKLSYIYGDLVSNENMVDLMQNYQCRDTLRFYGRLRGFQIDPLPLKATDLRIDYTHWMTVENVLQMDNVVAFKLGNAQHFTDVDYNVILKAIISGALPKMVYVHLELKRRYDRDVICQDIPLIQENSERLFSRYDKPHPDIGGFHFNLDNGDLGSIFFYMNARPGQPSTDIGIIVWRPGA
ncbi:hypothetical protein L3Y34_016200 [Caenorhabditis briggsae]|uniref:F-box domain-containing protein n=1 Tax=Caenorhabditis briggsae TaxID=6238 RepID=A0AAE9DWJ2_CAEBR|nr:hypothetical protein L3Y34_016200 [Caenorhabditis briggsae]